MNLFLIALSFLYSHGVFSRDLTPDYHKHYSETERLSQTDIESLRSKEIILIPGIFAELFDPEDPRGHVDFSILTTDYFSTQVKHLRDELKIPTKKLLVSSKDLEETKSLIGDALKKARNNGRKALFVTHSLGGLALLDYLLETNEAEWEEIEGIIFLQSPFHGSPIASVLLNNPAFAERWLKPILPFLHASLETVIFLGIDHRAQYMNEHMGRIQEVLRKIPTITLSGVVNGHRSLFRPGVDIMKHGCLLNRLGRCLGQKIWKGKYDDSDGLVPLFSSKLSEIDHILLEGLDHGGPVMNFPFQSIDKKAMTESLLKLLMGKVKLFPEPQTSL